MMLPALMGHQGDEGEQPQRCWGCSRNGQIGPLPLGSYAQVCSDLFKGHFELPALHEGLKDLHRGQQEVRTQQGLGEELALGITDQNPSNRERREAVVIPDRGLRNDLQLPVGLPLPAMSADALPARLRIVDQGG